MSEPLENAPCPEDHFLTLARQADTEIKIKRSRFIGLASPIQAGEEAKAWIQAQERRYHDSRHICYAWRVGHHQEIQEIRNDAGEPSGTAGEPILKALRKFSVTDAVVVVVRYFGGIKLGTGGLARAYGETAETVVARAGLRTVLVGRQFELSFPYSLRKTLDHLLLRCAGAVKAETYTEQIQWRIWLPMSQCETFAAHLKESTAGSIILRDFPESETS